MKIKVTNLRLRTFLGIKEEEQRKKQDIVINYSVDADLSTASEIDAVEKTLDYKVINKKIINEVEKTNFFLIESLVKFILDIIFENSEVKKAWVKVDKPHALRFADSVSVEDSREREYSFAILGIGSNIDPKESTKKCLEVLKNEFIVEKVSEFKTTSSMIEPDQDDFLNGGVLVKTMLGYEDLVLELKSIEKKLGRVKTSNKNAPRVIDIDVLVYNSRIKDENVSKWPFLREIVETLSSKPLKELCSDKF